MGLVLFIVAQILRLFLFPIGIAFGLIKAIWKQRFFKGGLPALDKKFLIMARSLDMHANYVCAELLNATLIKRTPDAIRFGEKWATISQVLGHNQHRDTLTKTGWFIVRILNFIERDHCLKAIGTLTTQKCQEQNDEPRDVTTREKQARLVPANNIRIIQS